MMFAPQVLRQQTEPTEDSPSRPALRRSPLSGHAHGRDPIEHTLFLQRSIGNQATQRLLAQQSSRRDQTIGPANNAFSPPAQHFAGPIQAKLEVGAVNDPLESEADHVAEQVLRMPDPLTAAIPTAMEDGPPAMQHKPNVPQVSRLEDSSPSRSDMTAPPSVHETLNSPGQPLDSTTRSFMEPRFGHDFSGVRVHTDPVAELSAHDTNARAYTVGNDLTFGVGQYAPETQTGRALIAHELVHVMQQSKTEARNTSLNRTMTSASTVLAQSVQAGRRSNLVQREPIAHTDPDGARLRVEIVDTFEAEKERVVGLLTDAVARGDAAYLQNLGMSANRITILLNGTTTFDMEFGNAAEAAMERAIRNNPLLNQYVIRGPIGRVARGVSKPDWYIQAGDTVIPVDLSTRAGVLEKLRLWRTGARKGLTKSYIEKGLSPTFNMPPRPGATTTPAPGSPPSSTRASGMTAADTPVASPPVSDTAASGTPEAAAQADMERTVETILVEELPSLGAGTIKETAKDIAVGLLKQGPNLAKGLIIGYVATVISEKIVHGSQWEEDAAAMDRANHVLTDEEFKKLPPNERPTPRDRDGILPYIPNPVVQIAGAVAARIAIDVAYEILKADVDNFQKRFQQNSGLTPDDPEYGVSIKAAAEMENSFYEGDWDKYIP